MVPEKLQVNINNLEVGQMLTVSDIEDMPEGAKTSAAPDDVVVQCVERAEELEEEAIPAGEVEPEIVGQKGSVLRPPSVLTQVPLCFRSTA